MYASVSTEFVIIPLIGYNFASNDPVFAGSKINFTLLTERVRSAGDFKGELIEQSILLASVSRIDFLVNTYRFNIAFSK